MPYRDLVGHMKRVGYRDDYPDDQRAQRPDPKDPKQPAADQPQKQQQQGDGSSSSVQPE
jgi:hypothetical protein